MQREKRQDCDNPPNPLLSCTPDRLLSSHPNSHHCQTSLSSSPLLPSLSLYFTLCHPPVCLLFSPVLTVVDTFWFCQTGIIAGLFFFLTYLGYYLNNKNKIYWNAFQQLDEKIHTRTCISSETMLMLSLFASTKAAGTILAHSRVFVLLIIWVVHFY